MPRKSQLEDKAEDNAIWPPAHTHHLLVLLEEFVQKNPGVIPVLRDFKVMAEKLLGPCTKKYHVTQVKYKYHRIRIVYGKFKK